MDPPKVRVLDGFGLALALARAEELAAVIVRPVDVRGGTLLRVEQDRLAS